MTSRNGGTFIHEQEGDWLAYNFAVSYDDAFSVWWLCQERGRGR